MILTEAQTTGLHTIEEAILDIKNGKVIIVVDDEDRENEGDFICAAAAITPEMINFMSKYGRGLICAPIEEKRAKELELDLMVKSNTALHNTAFTVSIDLVGQGCTTGISAYDRATGIKALVDTGTKADDFARPGHIFPLIAKDGGVLRRTGHTEAAVDLARMAGFYPAGVLVEILNEDGSMARLPQLLELSKNMEIKIVTIKDLVAYRLKTERLIEKIWSSAFFTKFGEFNVVAFRQVTTGDIHLAFCMGQWEAEEPVLVKVHSRSGTGDFLGILFGGYGEQLTAALKLIAESKKGVLVIIQEGEKKESVLDKIKLYENKETMQIHDSMEQRDYGVGAQILKDLGIKKLKLISNHHKKRIGLIGYGLEIVENIEV
ncbi:MAG: 3,4-dihydroxy-2-butanone-4-phosphate synthase [Saprospiraceae bacterium]|nr:3,4-dihydroxy-2-butanone-4-phosphate synthase [Saprospiraceae bacterium]MBK8370301.1 3,4-dihydroxy-2-butanone-4-phosphate synthase [Saprospiraceae bacterium]MBK8546687.1 3,4-dihydroxy-2-butanone-4-phosphate synthase [Saprospiraceae bacterium]MBK8854754.1 3,4-dihydroxy-2-butanone-4-phosphate synthase [Saprospiraceae bacterium]MBK9044285.1 3,4-dihydroxy-2-butanone-4-phosphate synthase [Saprospiraceae bacterium]